MSAIDKPEVGVRGAGRRELSFASRRFSDSAVRDLLLAGLTFSSGAVDSISFLALGKVFTAFMTGNLVFLGFGLAGAEGPDVPRVATSLVAFAAGVFLAVRLLRSRRTSEIWPVRVSLALGIAALAQAGFLAGWLVSSGEPSTNPGDFLVALFAFAMGLQSGAVMSLDVKGVFTTAATATIIFLAGDAASRSQSAPEMRRLVGVLAALVAGAAAGALLLLHARDYAPILPLVVTGLVIAIASVALKPAHQKTH